MDSEFEVTGFFAGPVTMRLVELAEAMETFYYDEMTVGDTLIIKRVS